jgi:hypothetical protein
MKLVKFPKDTKAIGFEPIGSTIKYNYYLASNSYGECKKRQFERKAVVFRGTKKECKEYFENQISLGDFAQD